MAEPGSLKRLRHTVEAVLARGLFAALALLTSERASAFGGWLARTIGPMTSAHRTAQRNMARALPNLSDAGRAQAVTAAWDNFGRTMAEYALLHRFVREGRIKVGGAERLAPYQDKPILLFCAHLANWEVIPLALTGHTKALTIVYRASTFGLLAAR